MTEIIAALKRMVDDDGYLTLDRLQAQYLLFVLYAIEEGDGPALKYAIKDLVGSLRSESGGRSA